MKHRSLASHWGDFAKAHAIPKNEHHAIERTGGTGIYGEIAEAGIVSFMDEIPLRRGQFADLGSGRGNVVAFVAHNYQFDKCHGIELSETRHKIAKQILSEVAHKEGMEKVRLVCGDLFDFDLHHIDVAFSDNLVFDDTGIDRLFSKVCNEMKEGTFFISMKPAPSHFNRAQLEGRLKVRTSWSDKCPIFVYRIAVR